MQLLPCLRTAAELNKTDLAYPSVLARFGVAQTKEGRRVGAKLNCRDILSSYCQRKKKLTVERLDQYDSEEECWAEALVEDRTVGPADTAATRIDFSAWLQILPRRLRRSPLFWQAARPPAPRPGGFACPQAGSVRSVASYSKLGTRFRVMSPPWSPRKEAE